MSLDNPSVGHAHRDFWSLIVEEVKLTATAQNLAITGGNVIVALPDGVTIERVLIMFKFGAKENTNAAANEIENTTQDIEVQNATAGTWVDGIDMVAGVFKLAATTREGGDVIMGIHDVKAEVDGDGTYTFRWQAAEATQEDLNFNDCQMGIRVEFGS